MATDYELDILHKAQNGTVTDLFDAINYNSKYIEDHALKGGAIETAQLKNGAVNGSKITLDSDFKKLLLNYCYPVGSYYWSSENDDPHDLFGGTWTPVKGAFLFSVDPDSSDNQYNRAGQTGGEKTHTLQLNEIPSHHHTVPVIETEQKYLGSSTGYPVAKIVQDRSVDSGDTGGGLAHNNMPPYITAYCWRRIPDTTQNA